jgi:hypothetical protein
MHLFFQSLIRHFAWWIASLWPGRHEGAPLNGRRLLFLLLCYPAFLAFQLVHWLGFLCDALCFSGYRKIAVTAPVFVLGIPRSGTTFLHRTLAADRHQFTAFSTWEAVLAPSITERKCADCLKAIDRALGAPLNRLIKKLLRAASGDFDRIHEVGLDTPEEDYLSLLPAGGCFILLLAFPFSPQLEQLGRLDEMPSDERQDLLAFYKRALQRHLYCHPGKRLLSKNAAFASWGNALADTFPDAKFLVCVREPVSALSSQLSSLAPARTFFGSDPDGRHTARRFTSLYAHFYASLSRFTAAAAPENAAVLDQADLRAAPDVIIARALDQLDIHRTAGLDRALAQTQGGSASAHRHAPDDFSLNREEIERRMNPAYQAILNRRNRIQGHF